MRTRLIRPGYWADSRMADLPDGVRLTYMGLWCLADDAGYFDANAREIAAELYRYRSAKARERQVAEHLNRLADVGCFRRLPCGRHGLIPTIPQHRIKGGQQLFTVQKEHDLGCPTHSDVGLRSATEESVSLSVTDTSSGSLSDTGSGPTIVGSIDPERGWRDLGERLRRKAVAH